MGKRAAIFLFFVVMTVVTIVAGCGEGGQGQTQTQAQTKTSAAPGLAAQTREGGQVSITATPQDPKETGAGWAFRLVLSTHSVDLSQDLSQVSYLIASRPQFSQEQPVADSKQYAPVAWEGDPPGGHHIEGILQFPPISPRPQKIELVIREVGGVERIFSWTLD